MNDAKATRDLMKYILDGWKSALVFGWGNMNSHTHVLKFKTSVPRLWWQIFSWRQHRGEIVEWPSAQIDVRCAQGWRVRRRANRQPTTNNHQQPTTNDQRSTTNNPQPPWIHHLPPTTHHPPSRTTTTTTTTATTATTATAGVILFTFCISHTYHLT